MPYIEDTTEKNVIELIERAPYTSLDSRSSLILPKNEFFFHSAFFPLPGIQTLYLGFPIHIKGINFIAS